RTPRRRPRDPRPRLRREAGAPGAHRGRGRAGRPSGTGPAGSSWDEDPGLRERAVANLAAEPERPLGLALLDQRLLAGIGNIYRSELCFLRRVHPAAPVGAAGDLGQIVDLARRLLVLNADRTVRATTGGMLGCDGDLWVYGRGGRPCRRCGTRIARGELG